jgi:hypothetical protein
MSQSPRPNPYAASKEPQPTFEAPPSRNPNPTWMVWTGRVVSALPVLALLMSAYFKFVPMEGMDKELAKIGWKTDQMFALGILEVACAIFYVIPQTSVLGAILLTGYLGGATATHVRVGDPWFGPVIIGVIVWIGLFLRDARLRALVPWRFL